MGYGMGCRNEDAETGSAANRGRQRRARRSSASPLHAGLDGVVEENRKREAGFVGVGLVRDEEGRGDSGLLENMKDGTDGPEGEGLVDADEDLGLSIACQAAADAGEKGVGRIPLGSDEHAAIGLNGDDNVVPGVRPMVGALNAREEHRTIAVEPRSGQRAEQQENEQR